MAGRCSCRRPQPRSSTRASSATSASIGLKT
jgi:hypothetical protein